MRNPHVDMRNPHVDMSKRYVDMSNPNVDMSNPNVDMSVILKTNIKPAKIKFLDQRSTVGFFPRSLVLTGS